MYVPMARKRKLCLEILQSDEKGECKNSWSPLQWFGQHTAMTTNDITGSVMKILITDSQGKKITINIGNNGSICEVTKNPQIEIESEPKIHSSISRNETNENITDRISPHLSYTNSKNIARNFISYTHNLNIQSVKKELKDHDETATESSISVRKIIDVISEGYNSETSELDMVDEFYAQLQRIKTEETNLDAEFETVHLNSSMSDESCGISRSEHSAEPHSLIPESMNNITASLLCRLCANEYKNMIDVHEPKESYNEITKKIEDCLSILVKKTDTRRYVCQLCLEKLELFYKFRNTVAEVQKQFFMLDENILNKPKYAQEHQQPLLLHNEQLNIKKSQIQSLSDESTSDNETSSLLLTRCLDSPNGSVKIVGKKKANNSLSHVENKTNPQALSRHNYNEDVIQCRICGEFFANSKKCYEHSDIHNSENNYPCSMCDVIFNNEEDSYKHSIQHTLCKLDLRRLSLYRKRQNSRYNFRSTTINASSLLLNNTYEKDNADKTAINISHAPKKVENKTAVDKTHDRKELTCEICGITFETATQRYLHSVVHASNKQPHVEMPSHSSERPAEECKTDDNILCEKKAVEDFIPAYQTDAQDVIKCRICGLYFGTVKSCHIHSTVHASENYHPCSMCNTTFSSEIESYRHSRAHIVVKPLQQKILAIDKSVSGNAENTAKEHKIIDNILCGKEAIKNQISTDKTDDDYMMECRICAVALPNAIDCYDHSVIHFKENYYPCTICYKNFTTVKDAFKHNIHHIMEQIKGRSPKNHCTTCGKRFLNKDKLRFHQLYHNPDMKPCYCEKCDKTMTSESALYYHMINKHQSSEEFNNPKQYRNNLKLDDHHKCSLCKKRFCSTAKLSKHKLYCCHSSLNPRNYSCFHCGKKFLRKQSLQNHMKNHM